MVSVVVTWTVPPGSAEKADGDSESFAPAQAAAAPGTTDTAAAAPGPATLSAVIWNNAGRPAGSPPSVV